MPNGNKVVAIVKTKPMTFKEAWIVAQETIKTGVHKQVLIVNQDTGTFKKVRKL